MPLKFLDAVPLEAALAIRREGRLDSMRSFLRKTWDATSKVSPFDDANIPSLAAELDEKVREADSEWRKIDRDLLTLVATQASTGLLAAGPLVASGYATWVAAAATVAGVVDLVQSTMRRNECRLEYPAGFFVDLQKGKYGQ